MACEWHSAPLGELISYIGKGVAPKYINDGPDATMVLGQKCVRNQALQYAQARFHNSARKLLILIKKFGRVTYSLMLLA